MVSNVLNALASIAKVVNSVLNVLVPTAITKVAMANNVLNVLASMPKVVNNVRSVLVPTALTKAVMVTNAHSALPVHNVRVQMDTILTLNTATRSRLNTRIF